ncbi:MAG: hypothetical protein A3H71_03580 [Candidatus Sungbacteria bacterium RIFCSPLOWO2_02_FULL_48_13b]|uniref:Uncharacterized protein n=2 Tax=Candidatus Sungiibacteriota TaxID=1817917 RepID=A0A1G2LGD7_9BACT|nr:MAG: hypothetical protein A3C12_00465 [Candidatus Sungbacteria bacterium RIFCSPHIGHO2_02_FULL_49_20]OHA10698.1 MAG: hypothetical protein A3H71_03580 [Candidatus Sungbacteria bacterium RIFCSPLOWO2_02_FULL_48_13b]
MIVIYNWLSLFIPHKEVVIVITVRDKFDDAAKGVGIMPGTIFFCPEREATFSFADVASTKQESERGTYRFRSLCPQCGQEFLVFGENATRRKERNYFIEMRNRHRWMGQREAHPQVEPSRGSAA